MTSILTNTSSMVALQTLKGINSNLNQVQSEISTGKSVASAKDNSAIWAISKVMESDVLGFQAISDSLSLGESTVAVARQASETVTDLLTQMKEKIVAAREDNVDRTKIQTDIDALKDQIDSVVSAAQFNGLNLVDGSTASADILASLDRDASGGVTSSSINVTAQNLSTGGYTAKAAFTASDGVSTNADTFATTLAQGSTTAETVEIADITYAAGDKISISIGDQTVSHTVTADEVAASKTHDLIAASLKSKIDGLGIVGLKVDFTADDGTNDAQLDISSEAAAYSAGPPEVFATLADLTISGQFTNAGSGGLGALSTIDVSDATGAVNALGTIETLIQAGIDAAAAFGSVEGRIETQASFISNLTDSLKSGIGSMVDADMEEASAKLQALQVQQQLGIQSLSIANQSLGSLI
ncbi:flagellin N-terminal helical domain-containing protein [Tropicimonas aquimaris]|uniref:Flagellin n=1 Tax=Tropicimonas aquimaris TaxID=914152 RepID=A0ABW3IQP0_9RHOB